MQYYIVEEEAEFLKLYGEFLSKTLSRLHPVSFNQPEEALDRAQKEDPAFIIINPIFRDVDPLLYLARLRKSNHPFILLARDPRYRFIVEAMRLGATDFINPDSADQAMVRDILIRTYLEKDRWVRMHSIRCEPMPGSYSGIDYSIQDRVFHPEKWMEEEKGNSGRMIEDQIYQTIFVGITTGSKLKRESGQMENVFESVRLYLESKGALIWPKNHTSLLAGFVDQDPRLVVDWMLEASSNMADEVLALFPGLSPLFVIASSEMVYQEDLSTVYSPAINIVSHIIKDESVESGFSISESIYSNLTPFQKTLFSQELQYDGELLRGIDFNFSGVI